MPAISAAKNTSLILHGVGLIVIYSMYGVLQEAIMKKHTYGPNNEHFTSSSLLIVFNRVFSVCVGLAILFYKTKQMPQAGSFVARLKPASPMVAYASVAACNFLSTTCQYEALKYVSYTTQSLAKCSKMIPVLVVGALVYKKQAKQKEWVAAAVIALGCGTYLFSNPPPSKHASTAASDDADFWTGLIGAGFLCGYLFFDGLVSTTQERVFGKNPSSSDPFGPDSPVLDQMVWTNAFAGLIALAVALLSNATGTFAPNLELLLSSPALLWDVCLFSGASALGLIVLLNTIASFGALTSSLIMTIRQFLSILINAVVFGSVSSVGLDGWVGVGWVASGIWIKMNRAYDEKKPAPVMAHALGSEEELERLVNGEAVKDDDYPPPLDRQPSRTRQLAMQYALPCAIPVGLAAVAYPFLPAAAASGLAFSSSALGKFVSSGGSSGSDGGEVALLPVADFVEDAAYAPGGTAAAVGGTGADDGASGYAGETIDAPSGGDMDYAAELLAAEESDAAAGEAETAAEVEQEIEELAEELAELEGSSDPNEFVEEAAAEVEEELGPEVVDDEEWAAGKARMRRVRRAAA